MNRARFEELVDEALDGLPEEFASQLDNVAVVVEDLVSAGQARRMDLKDPHELLGLYEGISLTRRSQGYAGALPDRITIFRVPIMEICHTDENIRVQVRKTVMHELGHYFGMDEHQLRETDAD
ncbi:MAG: metallopeptidase family protein [Thermoleophilia bacterium]